MVKVSLVKSSAGEAFFVACVELRQCTAQPDRNSDEIQSAGLIDKPW
jgi:hypothetical protein